MEEQTRRIILLIPDALQRDLAGLALQRAGFEVVMAREAADLPDLLSRYQPQALLLDLFLPAANGLEVLEGLQQAQALQGTLVFVVSRLAFPEVVLRARELGVVDFFVKPLDAQGLAQRIQRALQD
ncbi:response regulator [Bellilinea sp.]|jgi:PleD family two-component response regulator|uniref:Response regulator n=1 Tax=Bellilinea caldifistulae TaxID=360411 RepID=A0A7C4KZW6_9CHLR|nr:response regulator [Bellilinea sp.]